MAVNEEDGTKLPCKEKEQKMKGKGCEKRVKSDIHSEGRYYLRKTHRKTGPSNCDGLLQLFKCRLEKCLCAGRLKLETELIRFLLCFAKVR